nr:recombination protein RecR [Bacteroidota bacterium]
MVITYPSKLFEQAIKEFATLPGIGNKSALRMVLHLLKNDKARVKEFGEIIKRLPDEIIYCKQCHNISETEVCNICSNTNRDATILCVVENVRDVIAIENTQQYKGLYHVLGGIISPIDGIGPSQLNIETLIYKAQAGSVKEIIMALSTTMEGDTTVFYLYKKLASYPVKISSIARGISVGGELEYTDEITLGRSIAARVPYEGIVAK